MRLGPPWECDKCRQPIESTEDGWVQWLTGSEHGPRAGEITLVHRYTAGPNAGHGGCIYDSNAVFQEGGYITSDLPLREFLAPGNELSPDGLMDILGMLSEGEIQLGAGLELLKRLQIPGYEAARNDFKAAIADGAFEPNTPPSFHSQAEIAATLKYIAERG